MLDRQTDIHRELSLIESYEKNLVDAIDKGQPMDPLLTKRRAEEIRKKDLIRELERLTTGDQVTSIDEARLKQEHKARFGDIKTLLNRHVSSARQLLRVLMEHPLRCEAVQEGERKKYRVFGTGSYLPLLPEQLVSLHSTQDRYSVVSGVPNGI